MLLTLTLTQPPATDLGHLLHKHPDRMQDFTLGFGRARVFYPEASDARCTAALLLDLDPVALVRGRPGAPSGDGLLASYVNDRPYAASSFLSVAIGRVLGSALGGRCARPGLAEAALPLEAAVAPVRVRGGPELVRRLFEPLGYAVAVADVGGDAAARCCTVSLAAETTVQRLLTHLTVLVPVLDDEKHYWVAEDEIGKLLRRGEGWLPGHPERELIARRYLKHRRPLARAALHQLAALDAAPDAPPDAVDEGSGAADGVAADGVAADGGDEEQRVVERPLALNERRMAAVLDVLKASGAARVLDLGCGAGRLLRALLGERQFTEIVGVDASARELDLARERLDLDRLPERQRARLLLLHSALTYRDRRLAGYDAAALVEVVEHLDPDRLPAFERAVFRHARPGIVVLTTPNRDYNLRFPALAGGAFRHRDHRFEWTRAEFAAWAGRTAAEHGYAVEIAGIGESDPELGQPTQMAVFRCAA